MMQHGFTALMAAAYNGHDDIVDLLIKAGADTTLQGGSPKRTALQWAIAENHAKCVALLEAAMSIGLKFHEAGNIKYKQKKFGKAAKLYTYALR